MTQMKAPPSRLESIKMELLGLFVALVILGTATPIQAGLLDATASCTDEDQSIGYGGQSVGCEFVCEGPVGVVSVSVRADDEDATVSGNAECADGNAHCDGKKTCDDSDEYSGSGTGTCNADSDEWNDSGLYVSCSSEAGEEPPVCTPATGCRPPEWCIVTKPVPVCTNPWPPSIDGLPPFVEEPLMDVLEKIPPEKWLDPSLVTLLIQTVMKYLEVDLMFSVPALTVEFDWLETSSADAAVWERALSVLPTLPWEAATKDSYVFMHFDGETAIGISCRHGVCTDFQPVLINDPTAGFRLSTP